jgi:D-alanyl-D-alanine carboxypeptidase/D-alanyl-D-alanine-endopeptidase (penicillin-binding protein 4)
MPTPIRRPRHCDASMPRHAAAMLLLVALVAPPSRAAGQLPRTATRALDALLDAPPFDRNLWGVALVDGSGRLLYGRNADKLFIPASNTKLVVAVVAAARYQPEWTVPTSVYAAGPVIEGTLQGDLVLYGRGDPTFSLRCYAVDTTTAGACDADPSARLRGLASGLKLRGVRAVAGDLVGDGSWFDAELVHPDWTNYDLNWWYAAPVSGLDFHDNSVDIAWKPGPAVDAPALLTIAPDLGEIALENRTRTVAGTGPNDIGDRMYREPGTLRLWAEGTVGADFAGGTESFALPDPGLYAARAFRQALAEAGIAVAGTTRSTLDSTRYAAARATEPLAETTSRPLRDWIFPVLNTSQNTFAEILLKQLGRSFGRGGSWREGLAVERRFLIDSVGLDSTLFSLEDGSGLSAANLVSPLAFTGLLRFIQRHPHFEAFAAGLPRSGQTGSLRRRFIGTPLEGRVQAKTGSISRVNTLSGYFELASGRRYTFSVQVNHHALPGRLVLAQIDSVVVAMARAVDKAKK